MIYIINFKIINDNDINDVLYKICELIKTLILL